MTGKIVNLKNYKLKQIEEKTFRLWQKRFQDTFHYRIKLSQLTHTIIYYLACPGEDSTEAFYEIIMGALNLGTPQNFYYLENEQKMLVVDIHLFLADQTRFEMMRRLGWLSDLPHESDPVVELIIDFEHLRRNKQSPDLKPAFPRKESYQELNPKDREALIRSMLPKALEIFKSQCLL